MAKLAVDAAYGLVSKHEREVNAEFVRVEALARDGNVVGLIRALESQVRGRSEYSVVRAFAADRLGRLGDSRAIPHLIEMRDDPEEQVRSNVIQALSWLQAREAEGFLVESLKDSSPLLRMGAASALGRIGAAEAIPALRDAVDSDPDPYVRLRAVNSLVILGDAPARDRVRDALSAVEHGVREHPHYRRLLAAVETGEPLTRLDSPWESDPGF